jgi:Ca2+-binding EF-hand superfamily protein
MRRKKQDRKQNVVQNPMLDEGLLHDEDGENGIAQLVGTGGDGVTLTPHDEQKLRDAFSVIDHDGDGEVLHDELDAVLHVLGARPTEAEVDELLKHLDTDGDGDVEMDDWVAGVKAGKLQIDDHGVTMDLNSMVEIRQAFLKMDENRDGMLERDEFTAAMRLLLQKQHVDGRSAEKIWDLWATPMGDFSCEIVCWVGSFSDWSTEAPEMDPLRNKFFAEFSRGVAKQFGIEPGRVRVSTVLTGTTKRKDQLNIIADKVNERVEDVAEDEADAENSAEAESVAEYGKDICTVSFIVESLGSDRLIAAIDEGNCEAVVAELDKGVPVNRPALDTGSSPLHLAAHHGHAEVCRVLLERGADYVKKNRRNKTPLEVAEAQSALHASSGHDDTIDVFKTIIAKLGPEGFRIARDADQQQGSTAKGVRKKMKHFRKQTRDALKKSDKEGLLQAQIGDCALDQFHVLKFLHYEEERVITWPAFVKGYARLRHKPLGEKLTITDISHLSSSCLHKLIGEKEHLQALNDPETSALERWGIKTLSGSFFGANDEWYRYKDTVPDDEAAERNRELHPNEEEYFHGSEHVTKVARSPLDDTLNNFAEHEKVFATSTRKMILGGVIFCAISGGLGAFIGGLSDLVAVQIYQPDAAIECSEPTGSSAGIVDDCVEQRFILEAFLLIALPFMVLTTAVELGGMYYINMNNCMKISKSVGLVLWPLDAGRVKIARRMVQAAFEISPSKDPIYGIDPLRDAPNWKLAIAAVVHKLKMGVTKKVVKLLVKRMVTRAGAREASVLAAVSAFSMIPVGMIWNGVVGYNTTREARLRALGTIIAIQYVDKLLPLNGIHDRAGTLHDDVCTAIIRAIGCVAVAKRKVHVNSDTLLRRVHERLMHLDHELQQDDTLFEDSDGFGWGAKGFREADKMDDKATFLEQLEKISEQDHLHGEMSTSASYLLPDR